MDEKQRKAELLEALKDIDENRLAVLMPVIDEVVFLEGRLAELRKMPFIKTHPSNPALQKQTEAARQYVKLNASYLQGIKIICSAMNKAILEDDESPISKWLKARLSHD